MRWLYRELLMDCKGNGGGRESGWELRDNGVDCEFFLFFFRYVNVDNEDVQKWIFNFLDFPKIQYDYSGYNS